MLYRPGATCLISIIVSSMSSSELPQLALVESLHAGLMLLMPPEAGRAGKPLKPVPLSWRSSGLSMVTRCLHR